MKNKPTILVVDDNPINLGIVEEMLSSKYKLVFAQSGAEAVRLTIHHTPDAVLLDVMMPGMDGLETCRQIRKEATQNSPAIIMVSAKAMPSEQSAGINAGANDYITKPFDEEQLLTVLHNQLEGLSQKFQSRVWSREQVLAESE